MIHLAYVAFWYFASVCVTSTLLAIEAHDRRQRECHSVDALQAFGRSIELSTALRRRRTAEAFRAARVNAPGGAA